MGIKLVWLLSLCLGSTVSAAEGPIGRDAVAQSGECGSRTSNASGRVARNNNRSDGVRTGSRFGWLKRIVAAEANLAERISELGSGLSAGKGHHTGANDATEALVRSGRRPSCGGQQ